MKFTKLLALPLALSLFASEEELPKEESKDYTSYTYVTGAEAYYPLFDAKGLKLGYGTRFRKSRHGGNVEIYGTSDPRKLSTIALKTGYLFHFVKNVQDSSPYIGLNTHLGWGRSMKKRTFLNLKSFPIFSPERVLGADFKPSDSGRHHIVELGFNALLPSPGIIASYGYGF